MESCRLIKRSYHIQNKIINIPGSKNSSLAILPAILLFNGICKISNLAKYLDIKAMLCLLRQCGVIHDEINGCDIFDSRNIIIPDEFTGCERIRASYYFLGATVYSKKIVKVGFPGGCKLGNGERKIDEHIRILEFVGCKMMVVQNKNCIVVDSSKYLEELSGEFTFKIKSIGATVNGILALVKGQGEVLLKNIEYDPIIISLINFLNECGANICIYPDNNYIKIKRVNSLYAINFDIPPDPIVSGTFIIFVSLLNNYNEYLVGPIKEYDLGNFVGIMEDIGLKMVKQTNDYYKIILGKPKVNNIVIRTASFPGLYTDLQPFISLYLYRKKINAVVTDIVMPNRYKYVQELNKIGYNFNINNDDLVIVPNDVSNIKSASISCADLRGSMALLMASVVGILDGIYDEIIIDSYRQIQRGYLDIDNILKMFDIECTLLNSSYKILDGLPIEKNKNLMEICNIKIGGSIDNYIEVYTYNQFIDVVIKCLNHKIPFRVVGDGTNIYFENKNYHGIIIRNRVNFIEKIDPFPVDLNNVYFIVSCGTKLDNFVKYLANNSFDLSQMAGIPGTIGGAIYGNAGAYGKEMKDIIKLATLIGPDGKIVNFTNEDFKFKYRNSILSRTSGYTIISAIVCIPRGDSADILNKINNIILQRESKLPTKENTAGSFFKNINLETAKIPTGYIIGKIKDNIFLPHYNDKITLYPKHNNIIINNNGTCNDLELFVKEIKDSVLNNYGIYLENEVMCIHQNNLFINE